MADRKANLKSLFSNTRSRLIIVITAVLFLLAVTIGFVKFKSATHLGSVASVDLSGQTANIASVPGALNPTVQYAKLQAQQNMSQAQVALQQGSSAIPTIIRTQVVGQGVAVVGPQQGKGGIGFATLAREDEGGVQQSLWSQNLKDSSCSKDVVTKIVAQGAQMSDLKQGCSCMQLHALGYQFTDLEQVCSCKDLKAIGISARQFKEGGYTAARLRDCGFDACTLRASGSTAQTMKEAGFSDGELKGAGYSDQEIAAASGIPNGMTANDILKQGCQVQTLQKLRASGVTAGAIRQVSGCSTDQLKAAGYLGDDLKNAGLTAPNLLGAGFTPNQLKNAGYSARDLLDAGLAPAQVMDAGYSPDNIKVAESELPPGITPDEINRAGCSPQALLIEKQAGVSDLLIEKYAHCSASSDAAIKAAGCDPVKLHTLFLAGVSVDRIHTLNNCGTAALKTTGYPDQSKYLSDPSIIAAACDPVKLHALFVAGVSAERIHQLNGCSAVALKAAGYDAKALLAPGFTPDDLLAASFIPQDLVDAGIQPSAIIAGGHAHHCSLASLKTAYAKGISATTIGKTLGCSAAALKPAGYSPAQLRVAGFTAAEVKATVPELKTAGFTPAEIKAAGFTVDDALKDTGTPENVVTTARSNQIAALPNVKQPSVDKSKVPGIPSIQSPSGGQTAAQTTNTRQLQQILQRQNQQLSDQRFQQQIQQRAGLMLSAANQSLQDWKKPPLQNYIGAPDSGHGPVASELQSTDQATNQGGTTGQVPGVSGQAAPTKALLKTGDIIFAVLDTSVNSDQPGPILATIVSGQFKGARIIGSFNLPSNSDSLVISFNTMSVPGAAKSTSINAYAIDPNTAQTALSSRADHHYLLRYGSMFASSFLEGFGNAFQSANTTVTIGGTAGGDNVTVQNGIGRSALQNAVIGMATLGKSWGQAAQKQFSTPTTVEVFAGTPMGILFTQDLTNL